MIYSLLGFYLNWCAYDFFFRRALAKGGSNLTSICNLCLQWFPTKFLQSKTTKLLTTGFNQYRDNLILCNCNNKVYYNILIALNIF